MKWICVVLVLVAACHKRRLAPGETQCFTNAYGHTNCRTGQAAAAPPGWYCTTRSDGYGFCLRSPGPCENLRVDQNDQGSTLGACQWQQRALCGGGGQCFPNAQSCVYIERSAGRDGNGCYPLD